MYDITYIIFFFFQAEDGIRYVAVTGVQTCALPISASGLTDATSSAFNVTPPPPTTGDLTVTTSTTGSSQPASYTVTVDGGSRSEERRVGKESRIHMSLET